MYLKLVDIALITLLITLFHADSLSTSSMSTPPSMAPPHLQSHHVPTATQVNTNHPGSQHQHVQPTTLPVASTSFRPFPPHHHHQLPPSQPSYYAMPNASYYPPSQYYPRIYPLNYYHAPPHAPPPSTYYP